MDGMAWDGMAWHGMAWDGMAWDGMGWAAMRARALRELSMSLHKELDQAKHLHRRASTDLRIDMISGLDGGMPSRQAR